MYTTDDATPHHARIDFVYFTGEGLQLYTVHVAGEDKRNADIVISPYPSDHRAIVATFTLSDATKTVGQGPER